MKSKKLKKIQLITLLIVNCSLLISCGGNKNQPDASGVFEATEIIVSAKGNGEILSFDVQEGQKVQKLVQLGYIDTTQLYLKKLQLKINAKAVKNQFVDITKQTAALEQQIVTAKTEKQRIENLLKSQAATTKQLDDIDAQIAVLEKQLAAAKTTMQQSNSGVSDTESGVAVQIAQIEDQIKNSIIRSPIDGTVLAKYAEAGELAVQGKALFKVADINEMVLRAYITSSQLSQMKLGDKVRVFADFGEKSMREYEGKITWISPKAEFTPKTIQTRDERANLVYAIKISVKNDGFLKIGMYGEVVISD